MSNSPDKDIRFDVTANDRFSATFSRLKRDLSEASAASQGLQAAVGRVNSVVGVLALGGAAAGVGFGTAFRQITRDIDALTDASAALGDSVENISGLEDVARRNGASLDLVVTAVNKLNKSLSEAKPDSPMAKALEGIGLNAAELRKQDPTTALQQIAVQLAGYANDGNKARLVQELFGKSTREVAKFLKDLAEAGQLNATVTTQQAAEAEKFNDQLATLATQSNNAARALVGKLLPALNQVLEVFSSQRASGTNGVEAFFNGIGEAVGLGAEYYSRRTLTILAQDIKNLQEQIAIEPKGTGVASALASELERKTAEWTRARDAYLKVRKIDADSQNLDALRRQEDRGFNPLGKIADLIDKGKTKATPDPKISEAERYLESLRKQADKVQELTAVEQLLRDVQRGRIEGLTPAIQKQLEFEAQRLDDLRDGIKLEKQADEQRREAFSAQRAAAAELDRILAGTATGRRKDIERRVDIVLQYARSNPENDPVQAQALEALKQLREELEGLEKPVDKVDDEFKKLQVTIDRMAEQSVDAFVDLALGAENAAGRLFASFKRDVLRALIEDPVRDSMRSVVDTIRNELKRVNDGGNPLATLFNFVKGLFGSGGSSTGAGGLGDSLSGLVSSVLGGSTARAMTGPVRAGDLVRWQENGREWFIPDRDGRVVNAGQLGAGGLVQHNTFHINGYDAATMRRELAAALNERDARAARRAQYGRTYSAA